MTRLTTIWSIPTMTMCERTFRTREWLARKLAAKLPVRIRYWVAVSIIAKVSAKPEFEKKPVGAITADEILQNMDRPKGIH